jgi:hypothetical protein
LARRHPDKGKRGSNKKFDAGLNAAGCSGRRLATGRPAGGPPPVTNPLAIVVFNALALLAGGLFGPAAAQGGRLRERVVLVVFCLAVAADIALHQPTILWFLMLWASFGIGSRLRRRLETRPH